MNFKQYVEMASFTLPQPIELNGRLADAVDMQFELHPKTKDQNGKIMNQGSKFVAKMPNSKLYLAYDGEGYSFFANQDEIFELLASNYSKIPNDWWKKARFV